MRPATVSPKKPSTPSTTPRAANPQDRGGAVRHAAGAFREAPPAARARPRVGSNRGGGQAVVQRGAGSACRADSGAADPTHRASDPSADPARRAEGDQPED